MFAAQRQNAQRQGGLRMVKGALGCGSRLPVRVVLALFAGVLALLAGCAREEAKVEEVRIGLMAPLSNLARFTGHLLAQARVEEINAKGGFEVGGRKLRVRLIVADSGPTLEQTMSAMGRLVQQERVSAIIGPYYSREAIPVAAALESLRVPMLTPSATNPEVTRGRSFAFRVCQADSAQGLAMARYAHADLALRRVAVLYDEGDAYSSGLAKLFLEAFAARSGGQVLMEAYPTGAQDFSAQLERIRAARAQALFLPNFPHDLSMQIQQARALGFKGIFLGGDSWDTDPGFHGLPEAQGAVYSTDFALASAEPKRLAAAQALATRVGAQLDKDSALTLDALDLLLAAIIGAGSLDPVALRAGLARVRKFEGLTGVISYNGSGDPERSPAIMEISGGAEVLRGPLPPQTSTKGAP